MVRRPLEVVLIPAISFLHAGISCAVPRRSRFKLRVELSVTDAPRRSFLPWRPAIDHAGDVSTRWWYPEVEVPGEHGPTGRR